MRARPPQASARNDGRGELVWRLCDDMAREVDTGSLPFHGCPPDEPRHHRSDPVATLRSGTERPHLLPAAIANFDNDHPVFHLGRQRDSGSARYRDRLASSQELGLVRQAGFRAPVAADADPNYMVRVAQQPHSDAFAFCLQKRICCDRAGFRRRHHGNKPTDECQVVAGQSAGPPVASGPFTPLKRVAGKRAKLKDRALTDGGNPVAIRESGSATGRSPQQPSQNFSVASSHWRRGRDYRLAESSALTLTRFTSGFGPEPGF